MLTVGTKLLAAVTIISSSTPKKRESYGNASTEEYSSWNAQKYRETGGRKVSEVGVCMKDRYSFVAVLNYAEDGISIEFPDLPGCLPCAQNTDEAIANAREALGLHLFGMETDGEEIPEPTPVNKIELQKDQLPVLIDVFMPPIRARVKESFVKKTLSLPAWLAALADENGVNCSRVFQDALKKLLGVTDNQSATTA